MAGFIQIIDYTTSRADEIRALGEKMQANRQPGQGPTRVTIVEDRDRAGHFITIAEFESYEKAMENSDHPATQEFAAAMAELVDGAPTFINLDVVDTM